MLACQSCLVPNSLPISPRAPRAEYLFRKMNGGSQSSLVSASDGNFYVIKSTANPQGPNVVFNEAFGSVLAERLGLPTPLWRPIEVEARFFEENPGLRFTSNGGASQAAPGLYFGSNFVFAPPDGEIYETVPKGWADRLRNPSLFARMLLLDIWAENTDRRQALFIERPPSRMLDVVFFDHGHMFGGPFGTESLRSAEGCLYRHQKIYQSTFQSSRIISWMIRQIEGLREAELKSMLTRLPPEWRNADLESAVIARLLKNRQSLRKTVYALVERGLY